MAKFIKISSEKIFSMIIAFFMTGIVYLVLVGIAEGFGAMFATGLGNMFLMAMVAIIYVSPAVIFVGIPISFLADFFANKASKHQVAIKLGVYIVLVVLIALIVKLLNIQGTSAMLVLQLGLASAIGFWCGELLFSRIIKILIEKKIIKFSSNELK
ncbi:hypothetical protein [Bacillus massiliigorillae]|uniref:hypothetical protein n=1 Tax=Bacillus massiliigorillae TaxID=1243664 RepID=UPI0003A51EA2|nr:hypothetical protein [Bacillus massiliigorillae]